MHSQKNSTFKELIKQARSHKANNLPFVLYQLPNQPLVKGLFQNNTALNYTSNFLESGFVFSPFDGDKSILLAPDVIKEADFEREALDLNKSLATIKEDKATHIKLVEKAITTIKAKVLKKVVVSRKIEVATKKDEFKIFKDLLNTYPNAFKYLWYHPKIGMWIGATPETLLKVEGNTFTTTSLAGTLPVLEGQSPQWTKKEIEEQQLVTDYIITNLKEKVNDINATPATSVKAGKLWHLKSVITGSYTKEFNLGKILKILHPTPAVCGIPKEMSKEFILSNETYDREFYTGFLGELNYKKDNATNLFVNLRCLKLENLNATVFVGGGITAGSNAESEWKETQAKSRTMLNLL